MQPAWYKIPARRDGSIQPPLRHLESKEPAVIKLFLSINNASRGINSRIKGRKPQPENLAFSWETHGPASTCAQVEPWGCRPPPPPFAWGDGAPEPAPHVPVGRHGSRGLAPGLPAPQLLGDPSGRPPAEHTRRGRGCLRGLSRWRRWRQRPGEHHQKGRISLGGAPCNPKF